MGKVAGIKNKSLDTYTEHTGKPSISVESVVTIPVAFGFTVSSSILPDGAIEAGGSGDRIIVMFSGQLQWAQSNEQASPSTVTVGIYLDGSSSPAYSISALVPETNIEPATPEPTPFSMFWETPAVGAHAVDIRAIASVGTGAYAANGSLVLISTPV